MEMEKMTEKYNGWKNYETWVTALWIDNEECNQAYAHGLASGVIHNNPHVDDVITHASILAPLLKEWIEEINPLAETATLFADLLNAALSDVDWYELAENYLAEVR